MRLLSPPPTQISHVVAWTGFVVDWVNATSPYYYKTLLINMDSVYAGLLEAPRKANQTVRPHA